MRLALPKALAPALLTTVGLGFAPAGRLAAVTSPSSPSSQNPSKSQTPVPLAATRQIVPEYAPVLAVLMPGDLFGAKYNGAALVRALLEAQAEPWIAVDDARGGPELHRQLVTEQGLSPAEAKRTSAIHLPHGNLWLRDYGPVMVQTAGAKGSPVLRFADTRYDGTASAEDKLPAAMSKALEVPRDEAAVELDGGNLLAAGDLCFTSASGDVGSKATAASPTATAALGCRELVVIQDPPHVHIDMWMKVVSAQAALVNEIDDATLAQAKAALGHVPPELMALRDNLNSKAREIARYLDVERVPMPMPYRNVFRTYTNALLVNGTAIVPSYDRYGWDYDDYPDAQLKEHYEQTVGAAYQRHGFRTRFVQADGLIYNGGAFHCVMVQIPKLGAPLRAKQLVKGF